jgi:hypothetical protein
MRVAFFIIFCISFALSIDYEKEFNDIHNRVISKMQAYSPWVLETKQQKIDWYFCPQGYRGVPGMMGMPGERLTLNQIEEIDLSEITKTECDIDAAVDIVLQRLEKHIIYDNGMISGMPGPMGQQGRNSQEELKYQVLTTCYDRHHHHENSTKGCLTTLDVYQHIFKTFQNPIQCPSSLVGRMGTVGLRGKGDNLLTTKLDFDHICPFY